MGRATQGVTLIALDEGTKLSGLQRIIEADSEDNGGNGGNGHHAVVAEPPAAGDAPQ